MLVVLQVWIVPTRVNGFPCFLEIHTIPSLVQFPVGQENAIFRTLEFNPEG